MRFGLRGRGCIVTGAAQGIGRATAEALTREGARVLCVGREFAGECPGTPLVFDVCEPDAAEAIVTACLERFGRLDVLVNAEAELTPTPLAELTEADWDAQWELNVIAPMRLMRAAAPVMADAGWGRIVNVASAAGKRPLLANAAYSVTKAAELSLSRVFADRYAGTGVLINAVAPNPGEEDRAGGPPPIGRFGSADEAAAVVVFLCSDASSVVTGAAWSADGGAVKAIV